MRCRGVSLLFLLTLDSRRTLAARRSRRSLDYGSGAAGVGGYPPDGGSGYPGGGGGGGYPGGSGYPQGGGGYDYPGFYPEHAVQNPHQSNYGQNPAADSWCYECVTPRDAVPANLWHAMHQLYDLRGAAVPTKWDRNCYKPHNFSMLARQTCKYPFCYMLTLATGSGAPLTIRSCAESALPIDEKKAEELRNMKNEFKCRELPQDEMDIFECTCIGRQHPCGEKSSASAKSNSLSSFVIILPLLLLLCCCCPTIYCAAIRRR